MNTVFFFHFFFQTEGKENGDIEVKKITISFISNLLMTATSNKASQPACQDMNILHKSTPQARQSTTQF